MLVCVRLLEFMRFRSVREQALFVCVRLCSFMFVCVRLFNVRLCSFIYPRAKQHLFANRTCSFMFVYVRLFNIPWVSFRLFMDRVRLCSFMFVCVRLCAFIYFASPNALFANTNKRT